LDYAVFLTLDILNLGSKLVSSCLDASVGCQVWPHWFNEETMIKQINEKIHIYIFFFKKTHIFSASRRLVMMWCSNTSLIDGLNFDYSYFKNIKFTLKFKPFHIDLVITCANNNMSNFIFFNMSNWFPQTRNNHRRQ